MNQEENTLKWVDENGNCHDAKKVEEEFDSFIKTSLKRIVSDLAARHVRQMSYFPVRPDDILEDIAAPETISLIEQQEVKLDSGSIPLNDELLAEAIEKLTPREKLFIELDYVFELTDKDISKYLHIKKKSVHMFRYRLIRKPRRLMGICDEEL